MFALGMPYLDRAFARAGPPPAIAMRPSSQPAAASEEEEAVVPTGPAEYSLYYANAGRRRERW